MMRFVRILAVVCYGILPAVCGGLIPQQSLQGRIPHNSVVILEDGVDGQPPRPPRLDPEDILESRRFIGRIVPRIARLPLQSIDGADAGQDTVCDGNQHARSEQQGTDAQPRHCPDELDLDAVELALGSAAEKVVDAEQEKRHNARCPRVHEEQDEVLHVLRTDAEIKGLEMAKVG